MGVVKILNVSTSHLTSGLKDFKSLSDIPNQALIMANSGRHCRLFAYCYSLVETENKSIEIEMFRNENEKYKEATQLYDGALKLLTSNAANVNGFGKARRTSIPKFMNQFLGTYKLHILFGAQDYKMQPLKKLSAWKRQKNLLSIYIIVPFVFVILKHLDQGNLFFSIELLP